MAKSFNLTAKINAQLGNVRPVVSSLKRQLSGIKANVNINIAPNAARNITDINSRLIALNATLKVTASVARQASSAINTLGNAAAAANLAKIAQQAAQVNKALNNVGKQARATTDQMQEFGRVSGLAIRRFAGFSIATGAVFGLGNAFTSAIGKAIEFDKQLVRIGQATNSTKDGMKSLATEITRLSTSLGVSSAELSDISLILAQAGLSARDTKVALEALAKSSLTPTFTDITNTVEGSIAAISQFGIGVKDLESVLGSINAVSAQFAVESDDIIAAIRRTGGVFAAASKGVSEGKDALNEFMAVFTSIRATTRESAETIATGLRTIFTRFQRADTVRNLEELGIQLTDAEGKFVGAYKAVDALANGLRRLDPRDLRFSEIVEELGGYRQVSKVIPLISQTELRIKALSAAQAGQNSLSVDSEKAQEALANRIAKVREEFLALVREITETSSFKLLVDLTLKLTQGLIDLARTLKPLIPIFATLGAIKLGAAATSFTSGFFRGARGRNEGGYAPKFHNGGLVPGGRGVKDDYPATLQTGEYVIRRKAVDKLGVRTLDELNRKGYAEGGIVNQDRIGAAILQPQGDYQTTAITVGPEDTRALKTKKTYQYVRQGLPDSVSENIQNIISDGLSAAIDRGAAALGGPGFANEVSAKNLIKQINVGNLEGNIFEGMLSLANSKSGAFDVAMDPNRPFDFTDGFDDILSKHFNLLNGIKYIDAKRSKDAALPKGLEEKLINQLNYEAGISKVIKKDDQHMKKSSGRSRSPEAIAAENAKKEAKKAAFAAKLQRAKGGEVPAILTRGEYVLNKRAADRLGPEMLDRLNNADRLPKFHTGGPVGFASGGTVPSAGTTNQVNTMLLNAGKSGNPQDVQKAINELQSAINSFKAVGMSGKVLDRATREYAKAINAGKTQQEAVIAGQKSAVQTQALLTKAQKNAITNSRLGQAMPTLLSKGRGVKAAFGNAVGSFKGNPLAALGGIGIATQAIGQQFDPNGTNPYLQGTTGLLSGAAAGAAFGGPIGAVAGGLYGAASGISNAQIAKANEEANRALKKSTEEVDKAFKDFVKSGSLQTMEAAFASANAATGLKSSALRAEAGGVTGSVYGLLGQGVGYSKSEGQDFGANFWGSLGNMVGLVSDESLEKSFNRQRVGRYDQLSVENQANAQVAEQFFERQIGQGKSIQDILSSKSGITAAQNYLTSNLISDEDKVSFQSSLDRVQSAREGGNEEEIKAAELSFRNLIRGTITPMLQAQAAEKAMRDKLNQATQESIKQLDLFYDRMNKFSAAFAVANEGMSLGQQNLEIIANQASGISTRSFRTTKDINAFRNLDGLNVAQVEDATRRLGTRLGGGEGVDELGRNIIASKTTQDMLPTLIQEAINSDKIGDTNVPDKLVSSIKNALSSRGVSQAIINSVTSKARGVFESRKDRPFDAALGQELEAALREPLEMVAKGAATAADTLNAAFDAYQSGLEQYVKIQLNYNKALNNAVRTRSENELKLRELRGDADISLTDSLKPFTESITRLTGGKTDVKSIAGNITSLEAQRNTLLNQAANAPTLEAAKPFNDAAASISIALAENKEALETLSQDTTVLSEVQRRLADMEAKRQQAEKTLEDLAFGSREDKMEFNRRSALANRLLGGEQLRGPDLKAALDTIKELGNVLNAGGIINDQRVKDINKFGQNAVLNDPFLKAIFGGVDPGLKRIGGAIKNEDAERKNLIGVAEEALQRQTDASFALAKIQDTGNQYLQQLNTNLQFTNTIVREAVIALNKGNVPVNRNSGGWIPGSGPNKDTVPAMLTTGEFVVNRTAAQQNAALLEEINSGARVGFASGGSVTREQAIMAAIARKNRLGRSSYWNQIALQATMNAKSKAGGPASLADERIAVRTAYRAERNRRIEEREARYAARRENDPLRYRSSSKHKFTNTGMTYTGNTISQIARSSAQSGLGFAGLTPEEQAFVKSLSPAQRAMGSRLFKQFKDKKARTGSAYNRGGPVGGARASSRSGGMSNFDASVAQFGQYAQMFASSAAQFERAANILSKINIPNKIEMSGTHTVQVIVNGADVLSRIDAPLRELVTSEINKALSRHINPITGETTGDFNG